jgi:hypothetical protein
MVNRAIDTHKTYQISFWDSMIISAVIKKIKRTKHAGKLRIADHWNAISIIAKSQTNPLKAVAEFVENSIDARAKQIVIIRGKKKGEFYLKVSDDGEGISRDRQGLPYFRAWRRGTQVM